MTTRLLLVRHTAHDLIDVAVAGRMPGVHLNARGREQAERLAEQLAILPIVQVFSGPLERVRETAEPLCRRLDLQLQIASEFNEIDAGEWTGHTFAELAADPRWQKWNSFRSSVSAPGGEWMTDVQTRILRKVSALREIDGLVAIFSHGDVIRAAVLYFLGMPLDFIFRLEISPGSTSIIELAGNTIRVPVVNHMSTLVQQYMP